MTFAAVARMVGESWYRVATITAHYVELALAEADLSGVTSLAIDETSRARGHDYVTLAADAEKRAVLAVTCGRDAAAVQRVVDESRRAARRPEAITSVSLDMSPAFIKGVGACLPHAQITFDKFHVIAHASQAWTRPGAWNRKTIPTSRKCAGPCSRIAPALRRSNAPISMRC